MGGHVRVLYLPIIPGLIKPTRKLSKKYIKFLEIGCLVLHDSNFAGCSSPHLLTPPHHTFYLYIVTSRQTQTLADSLLLHACVCVCSLCSALAHPPSVLTHCCFLHAHVHVCVQPLQRTGAPPPQYRPVGTNGAPYAPRPAGVAAAPVVANSGPPRAPLQVGGVKDNDHGMHSLVVV